MWEMKTLLWRRPRLPEGSLWVGMHWKQVQEGCQAGVGGDCREPEQGWEGWLSASAVPCIKGNEGVMELL